VSPAVEGQKAARTLTFVLPKLPANETVRVRPATLTYVQAPPHFKFTDKPGESADLAFDGTPVLRYMNAPRDAKNHYPTFKPFHQAFDPADGKTLLSSGAGKDAKDGQFPHHRGIFYGFAKVSYGDKKADIWHGKDNVFTQHDKVLSRDAGEVYGRETDAISWHGSDGATFADETRTVTAFHTDAGTLIEWESTLSTKLPKVTLDGDPQHAGFHFRAAQEVAKSTAKETVYTRPDGKDKPGATRNWPAQKGHVNLPWLAMSFTVGGKRYTAVYLDRPENPKEARFSERDYGRFGSYFVADVTPEKPLTVKYRIWVQAGEPTVAECAALSAGFVTPPAVTVAAK
jgi:hypothetical protein